MDITRFYDDYVDRQTAVGVNERHHAIVKLLRRFGLRPGHQVLEIGCGVGTFTQLLAESVSPSGLVTALDLSPRSINAARERLAAYSNVRLMVTNVLETDLEESFDIVVLPDVIEHIPLEQHGALFERVASWVTPTGFVLLHYPNPFYTEWCREHRPEVLQIIDQPIHADVLLSNAYCHGLYLDCLETYSIWLREGDYVVAVLRPRVGIRTFTATPERRSSLGARLSRRLRRLNR